MSFLSRAFGTLSAVGLVLLTVLLLGGDPTSWELPLCTCVDGDSCWPSLSQWQELNASVDGRLIPSVPPASVCHEPNLDAAQCASVQEAWVWPEIQ